MKDGRKGKELEFNLSCALLVDKIIVNNVTFFGGAEGARMVTFMFRLRIMSVLLKKQW